MKISFILLLVVIATFEINAQNKTTYIGTVSSSLMVEKNAGDSKEFKKSTEIVFASRTIKIGDETYNIVSKQFDGISTSTFMCSKGRGHFVISFKAGEYISVVDKRTPGIEYRYETLKE